MKFVFFTVLLPIIFTLSVWSANPVPYSGKVAINGVNFSGQAQFIFSLLDGTGATHWRNGKQAGETVKVTIRNGRYSVLLGGQGMNPLTPELFLTHDKLFLKVEFDNGDGKGLRHLGSDQLITSTPKALVAKISEKVASKSIVGNMLSDSLIADLEDKFLLRSDSLIADLEDKFLLRSPDFLIENKNSFSLDVSASDFENDKISYFLQGADASKFQIDDKGILTMSQAFTPASVLKRYNITIIASDSHNNVSRDLNLVTNYKPESTKGKSIVFDHGVKINKISFDHEMNLILGGNIDNPSKIDGQTYEPKATWRTNDGVILKLNKDFKVENFTQTEGDCFANILSLDSDSNGNVYTVGDFGTGKYTSSKLKLGSFSINSNRETDPFISKLDKSLNWKWSEAISTTAWSNASGIDLDNKGNIVVCGFYYRTPKVGDFQLTNSGWYDAFIGKLSNEGKWIWVQRYGGSSFEQAEDVTHLSDDSLVFVGGFQKTALVGKNVLTSKGGGAWGVGDEIVIGKLSSNGDWLWSQRAGGNGNDRGWTVSSDSDDNIYIGGRFSNTADFGGLEFTSKGSTDGFISKLNSNGEWLWTRTIGTTGTDFVSELEVDSEGNILICGDFSGSTTLGNFKIASAGKSDVFVAKIDTNGNWVSVETHGGPNDDFRINITSRKGVYAFSCQFGENFSLNTHKSESERTLYSEKGTLLFVSSDEYAGVNTSPYFNSKFFKIPQKNTNQDLNHTITRDMLSQDVLSDLNPTITSTNLPNELVQKINQDHSIKTGSITKSMLGSDVLADLNRTINADKLASNSITTGQLNEQILKYLRPVFNSQPNSTELFMEENMSFSVGVDGRYLSYQWKNNGLDISGETNSTIHIIDANATLHDGNYTVSVTNDFGSVESAPFELIVVPDPVLNGLEGWWKFDSNDTSIAVDSSGNNRHGTLSGNPSRTTGKINGAMSFDGVDNKLAVQHQFFTDRSFSILFWFKDVNDYAYFFHQGSGGGRKEFVFRFLSSTNKLTTSFFYDDLNSNYIKETSWTHLGLTYEKSASTRKLYINGNMIASDTDQEHYYGNSEFRLGRMNYSYSKVTFDDVRIYNRPITGSDVDSIFKLGNSIGQASTHNADLNASVQLQMLWVEPGTFTMGSPTSETGRETDETEHNVSLTKGFYLGKYEVTQAQYEAVMTGNTDGLNATPSEWPNNPNRPVEKVSWADAQIFLTRLNTQQSANIPAGWAYVLPTESQWEYACRAGTSTRYSWGNDINATRANYSVSGLSQTRDVGYYAANPWGFFDMHGNVWEWVYDWKANYLTGAQTDPEGPASGSYRVARGGSWSDDGTGKYLRSAERNLHSPNHRYANIGFRVGFQKQ
jgi:formylglycine-generating enzyme required for sulfatase activity